MPCQIIGARLTYSRDDILSIRPSPNLYPSLVENVRSCGIAVNLPRRRAHRGGRRKQRRIQVLSRHTADPVAVPPPDFDLCVTGRRAGPNFNNLISIPLSLRPKSTPADTLHVALFNARSVNDPLKRAEISTFISDNQVDILFLTESWLRQQGDEAKCPHLAPMGYSVCSFPRPSRGGGIAVVYSDTLAKCLTSTSLFPFPPPVLRSRPYLVDFVSHLSALCMCLQAPARSEKQTH